MIISYLHVRFDTLIEGSRLPLASSWKFFTMSSKKSSQDDQQVGIRLIKAKHFACSTRRIWIVACAANFPWKGTLK